VNADDAVTHVVDEVLRVAAVGDVGGVDVDTDGGMVHGVDEQETLARRHEVLRQLGTCLRADADAAVRREQAQFLEAAYHPVPRLAVGCFGEDSTGDDQNSVGAENLRALELAATDGKRPLEHGVVERGDRVAPAQRRGDGRALKPGFADLVGQAFQFVIRGLHVGVGGAQPNLDPLESRCLCELEPVEGVQIVCDHLIADGDLHGVHLCSVIRGE